MKFDKNIVNDIDNKKATKLLLEGGLIYDIICLFFVILGLIMLIIGEKSLGIVLFFISLILLGLGIKNLFLKGENRERYLISQLVLQTINEEKKKGKVLSKEEIDKFKFEYDPIFHDKIIDQIHKTEDKEYRNNIINAENDVKNLETERENEIKKINSERWQCIGNNYLFYNLVEGKIGIKQKEYLFSSIKGARLYKRESSKTITTETGKSKKHGSIGGAVIGTAMAGPLGGVVGGSALGKTTSHSTYTTKTINMCDHMGVIVEIDDFNIEIVILDKTVSEDFSIYRKSLAIADEIIEKLIFLSKQPVPKNYIKVEDEKSVLDIDLKIKEAKENLEKVKNNKPTYKIPEKYLNNNKR